MAASRFGLLAVAALLAGGLGCAHAARSSQAHVDAGPEAGRATAEGDKAPEQASSSLPGGDTFRPSGFPLLNGAGLAAGNWYLTDRGWIWVREGGKPPAFWSSEDRRKARAAPEP